MRVLTLQSQHSSVAGNTGFMNIHIVHINIHIAKQVPFIL